MIILLLFSVSLALAKVTVAVSIASQQWMVKNIAGDLADVIVIVPAGVDAHSYEPKPAQMAELSKAHIYLACGLEFEKAWIGKLTSAAPNLKVYYTDQGFAKVGGDTHIWVSKAGTRVMVQATMKALSEADVKNAGTYQINGMKLLQAVDRTFSQAISMLAQYNGRAFMVNHPALGYFAADYKLRQIAIDKNGEAKPADIAAAVEAAKKEKITMIFAISGESDKSAQAVANEIGAKVEKISVTDDDWEQMIGAIATQLILSFN
jgi:zinc transport system substrate-binding protein